MLHVIFFFMLLEFSLILPYIATANKTTTTTAKQGPLVIEVLYRARTSDAIVLQ